MNTYELTVVLPGSATPAKQKSAKELIEKLVNTFKGKIKKLDEWGKIELAYIISGNESGYFLHYILELDSDAVKQIDDKIRLEEEVIRYLLVKKE